jgi:hypothetical protein
MDQVCTYAAVQQGSEVRGVRLNAGGGLQGDLQVTFGSLKPTADDAVDADCDIVLHPPSIGNV